MWTMLSNLTTDNIILLISHFDMFFNVKTNYIYYIS